MRPSLPLRRRTHPEDTVSTSWTTDDARHTYAIANWGEGYFEGERMHLKLNFGSVITGVLGTCEGDYYKVK